MAKPLHRSLVAVLWLLAAGSVAAQGWNERLQDGRQISIDPDSGRVLLREGGTTSQIPDGVHRLRDGTVITTESGIMVPTAELLERRRGIPEAPEPPEPAAREPRCDVLAAKVCGAEGQCEDHPACPPVRQLAARQDDYRGGRAAGTLDDFELLVQQCNEALADEAFFEPCTRLDAQRTTCAALVAKVCGPSGECAQAEPCAPARQMLEREIRERHESGSTRNATFTSGQCEDALADRSFFRECR